MGRWGCRLVAECAMELNIRNDEEMTSFERGMKAGKMSLNICGYAELVSV